MFNFGRAFAAYGGVFITLAMLWSWSVDGRVPDRWDAIGVGICLIGVAVILWAPRG
jgi:small multidrug resistance family-3 protein